MTYPESNAYPLMPDAITLREYGKVAIQNGCTKRELFAAMQMQGMTGNKYMITRYNYLEIAESAVRHADALIAELNKEVQS